MNQLRTLVLQLLAAVSGFETAADHHRHEPKH
jgi:hypothetical protein